MSDYQSYEPHFAERAGIPSVVSDEPVVELTRLVAQGVPYLDNQKPNLHRVKLNSEIAVFVLRLSWSISLWGWRTTF